MKNYEFSHPYSGIMKALNMTLLATNLLLLGSLVILYIVFGKSYYEADSTYFQNIPPYRRICYFAFRDLRDRKADHGVFESDLINILENEDYRQLDLTGEEKIRLARAYEDKKICKIVSEDDRGFRAFKLTWKESKSLSKFFDLEITDITELSINSDEEL